MRVSRRALNALTSNQAPPLDTRPAELTRLTTITGDVMDTLQDVFAGTRILDDQKRMEALLTTRAEIQAAWGAAAKGFVMVGRRLLELDEQLVTPQERAALKLGCERLFPFGEAVASQLRCVARAVDDGVLSIENCPASYSAAYQITLLRPTLLEAARREGLIAPRTTRATLIAFRKRHEPRASGHVDVAALTAEQRRIERQLDRMARQRRALEARAAEIERILQTATEPG